MATSSLSFSAAVDSWVQQTQQRVVAVFRESSQRVASIAVNGVPIDFGFARASVRGSLSEMPQIDPAFDNKEKRPTDWSASFANLTATIAAAEIGQTVFIGFAASYILPLEYGHSKQAPAGFVRLAAAQWQVVVNQVTQEAKARAA